MYRISVEKAPPEELMQDPSLYSELMIFYAPEYTDLICSYLDAQYQCLLLESDNGGKAFLPVFLKDGPLGLVANSSAFFGSHGGFIANNKAKEQMPLLFDALHKWTDEHEIVSLTIVTNPLLDDSTYYEQSFLSDCKDSRIGQFTFFPHNQDGQTLFSQFHSSRRGDYRKAKRSGVTVRFSQAREDLLWLAKLHFDEMTKMNGTPKYESFFLTLSKTLSPSQWKILVAEVKGEKVAALLLLYYNDTVEYFTPVTCAQAKIFQPMSALIYEGMLEAMSKGYRKWNWGGTWHTQNGVYEFKRKWGTTDIEYFYYTRLRNQAFKKQSKEELLTHYSGFYVLPFSELTQ